MQGYYKLEQAANTELRDTLMDYDGAGTVLLECYVLAAEQDELVYASTVDTAEQVELECVAITHSVMTGETRCYVRLAQAVKDSNGDFWLAEELHEEIFC